MLLSIWTPLHSYTLDSPYDMHGRHSWALVLMGACRLLGHASVASCYNATAESKPVPESRGTIVQGFHCRTNPAWEQICTLDTQMEADTRPCHLLNASGILDDVIETLSGPSGLAFLRPEPYIPKSP